MKGIYFLAKDGVELEGILHSTIKPTKTVIVAVHGMSSHCLKQRDDKIAEAVNQMGVDYICFNNRGSNLVRYLTKQINGKRVQEIGGTAYEDVTESYYDIVGAIQTAIEMGYEKIFLQGHSLGCTKIIYTYHRLKQENSPLLRVIKGILLLSLIDINSVLHSSLGEKYEKLVAYAEKKEEKQASMEMMPQEAFIHPISVKTFLQYTKYKEPIDVAHYEKDSEMKILNEIEVPLFMRWGNQKELILQEASQLVEMIKEKIRNPKLDIQYIDGATHNYYGKEEQLASQIAEFLKGEI